MNLILKVQIQNVKAKIESRETRAHRLKKKKSAVRNWEKWHLSHSLGLATWKLPWEGQELNVLSSRYSLFFLLSPGDWLTFCSITALDIWVREPSRTLEPEEEKSEDSCSHRLFPSTDTQLLLCSPSPVAPVLLGFVTFLPFLVLPGFEGVVTGSQLGMKTVLLPVGSLNPAQPTEILLSHVRLFATLWTVTWWAPLSMEFSRQEYWSGLPFPPPEDLPDPGPEPRSPAKEADSLPSEPPGKPCSYLYE